jgi:deoxyribodipyrimidine photo-lyase
MRALVWFRADLRVEDHSALFHACRAAGRGVVAVYVICPGQWLEHDWAPVKVEFILRNLGALRARLARLNIPLKILTVPGFAGVPGELIALAERLACDAIYFNREYEWNEARRDERVARVFESRGLSVHAFHDQVLFPPGEIRTQEGRFYTVYSPFKRACWARYMEGDGWEVLPAAEKSAETEIRGDEIPDRVPGFGASGVDPALWAAGEAEAQRRLARFIETGLDGYKERRDSPGVDGTSVLSPYLAAGVLSPRQCIVPALDRNGGRLDQGNAGSVTWIQELLWREFYRHVMVGFPRVCKGRAFRPEFEAVRWRDDREGLGAWKDGRTGYPIVDAAMRALRETGWMHNRLRMVSAMFLTKHLLIDWREGERHFMRHLIDGDLASNNGGWQWSASTGTDAQPYFRIFNPVSQSRNFDPEGAFIRRWVPELGELDAKIIHEPWVSPLAMSGVDYPPPIVDQKAGRERALAAFEAVRAGS